MMMRNSPLQLLSEQALVCLPQLQLSFSQQIHSFNLNSPALELPLYLSTVRAGFPSPADDFVDCELDLNDYLIQHPAATFFVKAVGNSMQGCGIHSGDLLVIDKALRPRNNSIVVAVVNGEFTVKRLRRPKSNKLYLVAENPAFAPIEITSQMEFEVWGVVTAVIHQFNQVS